MARPGVGYFEVVEAANHLLGQGKNPTIEQIRHLLGTGSSTTLANHLRQWKNDHSQSQKLSIQENLPKEFLSLMQGLWKRLREEALEKVAQEELVFQARVDALLPELEKYKNNNRRWQKLYSQWMQERTQWSEAKTILEKELRHLQRESAAWVEKQEALLQQLKDKQDRIQELQRLQQQTQMNWEHFRESTRTQRLVEQQRYEKEKQGLQLQMKEVLSQQNQLKKDLSKREKQYQESSQKATHFKNLYHEVKQKNESQDQQRTDLKTEIRVLTAELKQAHQKRDELQAETTHLGQEKWAVTKEKAQLEGQLKQLQSFIQYENVKVK